MCLCIYVYVHASNNTPAPKPPQASTNTPMLSHKLGHAGVCLLYNFRSCLRSLWQHSMISQSFYAAQIWGSNHQVGDNIAALNSRHWAIKIWSEYQFWNSFTAAPVCVPIVSGCGCGGFLVEYAPDPARTRCNLKTTQFGVDAVVGLSVKLLPVIDWVKCEALDVVLLLVSVEAIYTCRSVVAVYLKRAFPTVCDLLTTHWTAPGK